MTALPKHARYKTDYKPNETYWGIGIECETYIELLGEAKTTAEFLTRKHDRERYSVNYWTQYKPEHVQTAIAAWLASLPNREASPITLPLLLNGHSLTKTDIHGAHATTFQTVPQPNPAYAGQSLLDVLEAHNPEVFKDGREVWWTLDGDTIEFMTQHYYCAKIEDAVDELLTYKQRYLAALQAGLDAQPAREDALRRTVAYPAKNYGFAAFLTNRSNVAIFNNGTYHINITLPTRLDADARIADMDAFRKQHQCLARYFQWITPFLIARVCSGDAMGDLAPECRAMFPRGSQRLCASRYVGVGTFDTDTMPEGKLLTLPRDATAAAGADGWYERIYSRETCAYERQAALGLDINYRKHWNHGLELRIFDWFPEALLADTLRLLVWMCDESLAAGTISNPTHISAWHRVVADAIWFGRDATVAVDDIQLFGRALRIPALKECGEPMTLGTIYDVIWDTWKATWNCAPTGSCTARMTAGPARDTI